MKGFDYVANGFLRVGYTVSETRCCGMLRHTQSRRVRCVFSHSLFLPYHVADAEHFQRLLAEIPPRNFQTIETSLHSASWSPCAGIAPSEGTRVFTDSLPLYPLFTEFPALTESFAEFDTTRDRCL